LQNAVFDLVDAVHYQGRVVATTTAWS